MQQVPQYNLVQFEPLAYREPGSTEKTLLTRDKSLEELRKRRYERHPSMREFFSLVCAGFEGKLTGVDKQVFDDVSPVAGEFLHETMQVLGGDLVIYQGAENLRFLQNHYDHSQMTFSDKEIFRLYDLKPGNHYRLSQVFERNPALGERIWSRPYDKLPEKIQWQSGLVLPVGCLDQVWPVIVSDGFSRQHCVVASITYNLWASRGVRRQFPLETKIEQ